MVFSFFIIYSIVIFFSQLSCYHLYDKISSFNLGNFRVSPHHAAPIFKFSAQLCVAWREPGGLRSQSSGPSLLRWSSYTLVLICPKGRERRERRRVKEKGEEKVGKSKEAFCW